ncbi:MAG: YkgJ family cysteine cluster protein [Ectothiorhodospiraceae bacterium]|jgi:Fe-S-cluster containining protein|nr:YkgJ family cysteine cluster protein [Ectothiorhodospiraceae bacterium]
MSSENSSRRVIPVVPDTPIRITSENKCGFCTNSKCCTYVTQAIDAPRSKYDFDHLLWQISHEHIRIYKDEDGWYLLIETRCLHLQPNGRCGIYFQRPQVCRDHSNDYCELDAPAEDSFELYFDGYEALLAYCRKRFKRWDRP